MLTEEETLEILEQMEQIEETEEVIVIDPDEIAPEYSKILITQDNMIVFLGIILATLVAFSIFRLSNEISKIGGDKQ